MHENVSLLRRSPILLVLLFLFGAYAASAQDPDSKRFPDVPARAAVEPTSRQLDARDAFQREHPQWRVRWNETTRSPASVLGPPVRIATGGPEQAARKFLVRHHALFGMGSALADLRAPHLQRGVRADHVRFQQEHAGLPIEGAVYAVHMTKDGEVYYASGDYYDEVAVDQTAPNLSLAEAIEIAQRDLGQGLVLEAPPEGKLVILPYGDEYRLAWKLLIPASTPLGRWVYYISAHDGKILTGYNELVHATADGDVYDHHPDAGPVVPRTLTHLLNNGYELDGSYVEVLNDDGPEAYQTDGTFDYAPSSTHFDEVMVYYHATEFQKHMGSAVGYAYLNYPNTLIKVEATVHYGNSKNNAVAIFPRNLRFYDGDGVNRNDTAKEDNVIAHEYQHLITYDLTYDGLIGNSQENAMREGFSDFFAGSYTGSPLIGEYFVVGAGVLRNLDNSYTVSDWDSPGEPNTDHEAGQIFSGALWDLRQQLGTNLGNVLAFEGLDNLDQSSPDFLDGRDAVLAADNALYGGANRCAIHDAFAAREIGYACPEAPTSISLGNPGYYGDSPRIAWGASPTYGVIYNVYRSINGGAYVLIASVSGQTDIVDYNAMLQPPGQGDVLRYYVVAEKNGVESEPTNVLQINGYAWKRAPGPGDPTPEVVPEAFALHGNHPNPFNPATEIHFDLPEAERVRITVYDLLGREVGRPVDRDMEAGSYHVVYEATHLPSGVYLYRLTAGAFSATGQMTLVK